MKISKKDALAWFEFFSTLPEDEELMTKQQEDRKSTRLNSSHRKLRT